MEVQNQTDIKVNPAYYPLFSTNKRYIIIKGSAGSGKSRATVQFLISCLLNRKKFTILAMHKYENKIRTTVFKELTDAIGAYGLSKQFKILTSPFSIEHKVTGSQVIFLGLDDPEKLKSISGIGLIWWEEATNFTRADFLQANSRMRGKGIYILINSL